MISVGKQDKYKDFYNYLLLVRGVRESTAIYYVQKVGVLFRITPTITTPLLLNSFARLKSEGCKNSYINKFIDVARIYCDFRRHNGYDVDHTIYDIKYLKEEHPVRATMSDSEIEAFLSLPPRRKGLKEIENYNRWTLFFKCLFFSGCRPQEIARLEVSSCDFGQDVFIITEEMSKTHMPRLVPIAPNIRNELYEYVKTCDKYLFPAKKNCSRFGIPVVDNVDWGYNFHERIKRLGINRPGLCPYSARHSMATKLLSENIQLFTIMALLGHTNPKTTMQYSHLTTKHVAEALTKHPLIRKATDPRTILDAFKEVVRSFEFEKNKKFRFSLQESSSGVMVNIGIA